LFKIAPQKKGFNNFKIINEEITEFYVIRKNGTEVTFTIDTDNLEKLIDLNHSWNATYDEGVDNYYGVATYYYKDENGKSKHKSILLHETIAGYKYVDHINHDTKDNTKINLRPTIHSPNLRNRKGKNKNSKSGIRNVSWNGSGWSVQLMVDGKNTTLKRFKKDQLKEASIYAEEMRQKYYGEWAGKGEILLEDKFYTNQQRRNYIMNLYQVMTKHYAPKDGHKAIWGYVVSESNEHLYEWLKSEPRFDDENDDINNLYLSWQNKENDDEDYEEFKTAILESCDEEDTGFEEYNDLYYGKTFVSWKVVKENVKPDILQLIKNYGIRIFDAR